VLAAGPHGDMGIRWRRTGWAGHVGTAAEWSRIYFSEPDTIQTFFFMREIQTLGVWGASRLCSSLVCLRLVTGFKVSNGLFGEIRHVAEGFRFLRSATGGCGD
jgi:hypothetical protein